MNKFSGLLCICLISSWNISVAQDPVPGGSSVGIASGQQTGIVDGRQQPAGSGNILELLNRLDSLQKELRQMRGEVEVVNHELSGIKRRQRELYLDMDRRLREVELGSVNAARATAKLSSRDAAKGKSSTSDKAAIVNTDTTTSGKPKPPTREEKDAYRSAFNLLKEGRYERSIKAFAEFMKKYPVSTYSDNAQYWLGEANYVSRKYKSAVTEFGKVISTYADSPKVPDAMLKLGFTHYELKQWDKARGMLEGVVQELPNSSAAKLAGTRLKRLQREGH